MTMINLTIITVCYNAEADLHKTLDSVLLQTYRNYEYIVVDGNSKDGTISLLESYRKKFKDAGISFSFISESDAGTYDAMNKGAKLANGLWINYLNAGDEFYDNHVLEAIFRQKIDEKVGVLYGDTQEVFDFGSGIAKPQDIDGGKTAMPFCHQSSFVRTEIMGELPFDLSYRIIADHDFFYRLRKQGVSFQYIPITVASYNGQYGLSATHPLTLWKENLRVRGINHKWYYPFSLLWVYFRYGWVQPFKKLAPRCITNAWMKYKRKYIR